MPELDGYQATRIIRNTTKMNTPIIAMTSHSIVGEKEGCLAAGMNDFISNPFNPLDLYNKITQHLPSDGFEESFDTVKMDISPEANDYVLYLSELSGRDKQFDSEIINLFLVQVPNELNNYRSALEDE